MRNAVLTGALVLCAVLTACSGSSSAPEAEAPASRVVVLGFDGVDPDFLLRWADELPHIRGLMETGTFRRLTTTTPPASCTAWTSFATGTNPGQHGIFDFIYRDPKTYLPDRSGSVSHKAEYLWGLFRTRGETFTTTMTGQPFWGLLDDKGLRTTVLRVPCLFPLEVAERGRYQAGLGAPDLRGTEGTFHYFSSALTPREASDPSLGGKVVSVPRSPEFETVIEGPADPLSEDFARLTVPMKVKVVDRETVEVEIDGHRETLKVGHWSDWVRMDFKVTALSSIAGLARMRLVSVDPDLAIYLSPINHDPADPAIRVTEPYDYATDLHAELGDFKTVGWNHETWGLNEERIDEDAFMADVFATMRKTEEITLHELEARPAELFVSVFVETDRTSHMMYRLIDEGHPRYDAELAAKHGDAILQTYRRMDEIIGKLMGRLGPDDTLFILSDHGFHSWRRGFNVNSWLVREGYMRLKNGADSTERKFLLDVDWSKTQAYAIGVGAIYLNVRGREGRGIVAPGPPARRLAEEIAGKLRQLRDPAGDKLVVSEVYLAGDTWVGPRVPEAQDLQLGLASGYRVSSATPLGGVPEGLFEDNMKKWSGDHATSDTSVTEGVFLSNRPVEDKDVSIIDLAPTILELLGVRPPGHYDGNALTFTDGRTP